MKAGTFLSVVLSFAAAGCVGDGVEFGGVAGPGPAPANTVPCDEAGLTVAERARVIVPDEVPLFFIAAQNYMSVHSMRLSYDVDEQGKALNVRYIGPPEYLRHSTRQKLIRSASDYVQASRYAWPGEAGFATDCKFELSYIVDWDRAPDGIIDQAGNYKEE
jgi:hypothetical protein